MSENNDSENLKVENASKFSDSQVAPSDVKVLKDKVADQDSKNDQCSALEQDQQKQESCQSGVKRVNDDDGEDSKSRKVKSESESEEDKKRIEHNPYASRDYANRHNRSYTTSSRREDSDLDMNSIYMNEEMYDRRDAGRHSRGYDRYDRYNRYGRYDRYDRYGRYDRNDRHDRHDYSRDKDRNSRSEHHHSHHHNHDPKDQDPQEEKEPPQHHTQEPKKHNSRNPIRSYTSDGYHYTKKYNNHKYDVDDDNSDGGWAFTELESTNQGDPHCQQIDQYVSDVTERTQLYELNMETDRIIGKDWQREPYRRRKDDNKTVIHWGQRKLFFSELEFFLKFCPHDQGTVLYVGSAPGKHILALNYLFPDIHFILYDPASFNLPSPSTKYDIRKFFFYEEDAKQFAGWSERHQNIPFYYISDIRSVSWQNTQEDEVEARVQDDLKNQQNCHFIIKPEKSLLKFRLPWREETFNYVDGDAYLQVWSPPTSTETRLVPSSNEKTAIREWNCKEYEEQLFYWQTHKRGLHYKSPIQSFVLDHCYDCVCEGLLLTEYFKKHLYIWWYPDEDVYNEENNQRLVHQPGDQEETQEALPSASGVSETQADLFPSDEAARTTTVPAGEAPQPDPLPSSTVPRLSYLARHKEDFFKIFFYYKQKLRLNKQNIDSDYIQLHSSEDKMIEKYEQLKEELVNQYQEMNPFVATTCEVLAELYYKQAEYWIEQTQAKDTLYNNESDHFIAYTDSDKVHDNLKLQLWLKEDEQLQEQYKELNEKEREHKLTVELPLKRQTFFLQPTNMDDLDALMEAFERDCADSTDRDLLDKLERNKEYIQKAKACREESLKYSSKAKEIRAEMMKRTEDVQLTDCLLADIYEFVDFFSNELCEMITDSGRTLKCGNVGIISRPIQKRLDKEHILKQQEEEKKSD